MGLVSGTDYYIDHPGGAVPGPAPSKTLEATTQLGIANQRAYTDYVTTMAQLGLMPSFGKNFSGGPDLANIKGMAVLDTVPRRAQQLAEQKFGLQKDWVNRIGGIISDYSKSGGAKAPEIAPGPQVTPAGVFSPEEMIAQQNMIRDRSMQQAAGMEQRMRGRMASRGAAVNSPLLAALQNKLELGGRVGGEQGALDFARQAAEANARNILQGQSLAQQIHDAHQKNLVSRYQAESGSRNQLLQILTSLAGML